jgi:hypothetical protein
VQRKRDDSEIMAERKAAASTKRKAPTSTIDRKEKSRLGEIRDGEGEMKALLELEQYCSVLQF